MLDVVGVPIDEDLITAWRTRIERAGARLAWINRQAVARPHAGGVSLAIAAPGDQLFLATEVNEWALSASLVERDPSPLARPQKWLVAEAVEAAEGGGIRRRICRR